MLERLLREYDDDNTGIIDYRKFCENVLGSRPVRPRATGGWGGGGARGGGGDQPGAETFSKF
jgi:hypothetical protein